MKYIPLTAVSLALVLGGMPFFGGCKSATSGSGAGWRTPLSVSRTSKGDNIDQPAEKANPQESAELASQRRGKTHPNSMAHVETKDNTLRPDRVQMAEVQQSKNAPSWVQDAEMPEPPPSVQTKPRESHAATEGTLARNEGGGYPRGGNPDTISPMAADPAPEMGLSMSLSGGNGPSDSLPMELPTTLDGTPPPALADNRNLAGLPGPGTASSPDMVSTHPQLGGQPHFDGDSQGLPGLTLDLPNGNTPAAAAPATAPSTSPVLFAPGNINPAYPNQP